MNWIAYLTWAILAVNPTVGREKAEVYAGFVTDACPEANRLAFIALISVESSWEASKVSETGDIGLGQVNLRVWGPVFQTTRERLLDPEHNIRVSCTILTLVHMQHGKKPDWLGYYHSRHPLARAVYLNKVNRALARLNETLP